MGFIYKIEIDGELYIGSTKNKLYYRQSVHNHHLNNINSKKYNYYLYRFCREKKVEKIICEIIEEVYDNERVLLEQEYISMLEPSLNSQRAIRTEQEKKEQTKEFNNKYRKIKSNCPICNKQMIKMSINRHIKLYH